MSGVELNGKQCVGLEITTENYAKASEDGLSAIDTGGVTLSEKNDDWLTIGGEDEVWEADDTLENQDIANEQCRREYDLNSFEEGFCCQAMVFDYEGFGPTALFTDATKTQNGAAEIIVDLGEDVPVLIGAEVFASAKAMGASLLTIATSALVLLN